MKRFSVVVLVFFMLIGEAWGADRRPVQPPVKERLVLGWLESIFVKPWNIRLTAKLDTGAKTSSLHTDTIEHFTKDGQPWVRFRLSGNRRKDHKGIVVERPLARIVYVKDRLSDASRRDAITLAFCKNGKDYETEFTLVDRSNFNYPVLLGRSFLKGVALVDANATFLIKSSTDPCAKKNAESGSGPLHKTEKRDHSRD